MFVFYSALIVTVLFVLLSKSKYVTLTFHVSALKVALSGIE